MTDGQAEAGAQSFAQSLQLVKNRLLKIRDYLDAALACRFLPDSDRLFGVPGQMDSLIGSVATYHNRLTSGGSDTFNPDAATCAAILYLLEESDRHLSASQSQVSGKEFPQLSEQFSAWLQHYSMPENNTLIEQELHAFRNACNLYDEQYAKHSDQTLQQFLASEPTEQEKVSAIYFASRIFRKYYDPVLDNHGFSAGNTVAEAMLADEYNSRLPFDTDSLPVVLNASRLGNMIWCELQDPQLIMRMADFTKGDKTQNAAEIIAEFAAKDNEPQKTIIRAGLHPAERASHRLHNDLPFAMQRDCYERLDQPVQRQLEFLWSRAMAAHQWQQMHGLFESGEAFLDYVNKPENQLAFLQRASQDRGGPGA